MTRTDILNLLAERIKATSYLEIGVADRDLNFNHITCPHKIGVDPSHFAGADYTMTSDEFFLENKDTFDLIFIDGLHYADQAYRDVINALKILNERGNIVMHDCNPMSEIVQNVPRKTLEWTGDVWKAFVRLRKFDSLYMFCVDTDYGVGVISKGKQKPLWIIEDDLTFNNFSKNRTAWLNLISPTDFIYENTL